MDNQIVQVLGKEENLNIVKTTLDSIGGIVKSFKACRTISNYQMQALVSDLDALMAQRRAKNWEFLAMVWLGVIKDIKDRITIAQQNGQSIESEMELLSLATERMREELEEYGKK